MTINPNQTPRAGGKTAPASPANGNHASAVAPVRHNGNGTPGLPAVRQSLNWQDSANALFIRQNFLDYPPLTPEEHGQWANSRHELEAVCHQLAHLDRRRDIIEADLVEAERDKYREDRRLLRVFQSGNGVLIVSLAVFCVANGSYLIHQFQESKNLLSAILMVAPLGLAGLALDYLIHDSLKRFKTLLNVGVLVVFLLALGTFAYSLADQVREADLALHASSAALRAGTSRTTQLLSQIALEISMATVFFGAVRRHHALPPARRWLRRTEDWQQHQREREPLQQRRCELETVCHEFEERDRRSGELQQDFINRNPQP